MQLNKKEGTYESVNQAIMNRRSHPADIVEEHWKLRQIETVRKFRAHLESSPFQEMDKFICNWMF